MNLYSFLCSIPFLSILFRPFFYKVHVEIYEKVGDAIVKKRDFARRAVSKGIEEFHLLKENSRIEPPKYQEYIITKGGKPLLMLFKATTGEYRNFKPVEFATKKIVNGQEVYTKGLSLTVTDKNVLLWLVNEYTRNWLRFHKPKWYEIYAPYLILAITGVLIMIMIIMVSKELTLMSGQLGSVASSITKAADTFRDALAGGGLPTINPPPIS